MKLRIACMAVVLCAMGVFLGLGLPLLGGQSATMDEVAHIGAAMSSDLGGARLNREHPPLTRHLAAWGASERLPPLAPPEAGSPATAQWQFGRAWLHGGQQPATERLQHLRLPLLLLASLLVPMAAGWATALYGWGAGAAAAGLAASSPLWLAHGTLVTTDAAMSLFLLAACFGTWGLVSTRSGRPLLWHLLCVTGVVGGMASKYSMAAGVALIGLATALSAWRNGQGMRKIVRAWGILGASAALGILLGWGVPPRPDWYLEGLSTVGYNHPADYTFYAFGTYFQGRDPSYLIRALLVKLQPAVILLAAAGVQALWASEDQARRRSLWFLCMPPLGYLLLLSLRAPAIGVRYGLPVLPFLIVLGGVGAASLGRHHRLRLALPILLVLQVLGTSSARQSSPLAWFNGIGGCTADMARPCLDDSNADWGQSLPALRSWRDREHPESPIRIGYFGSSPVAAYVPDATAMEAEEFSAPREALYAISVQRILRPPRGALEGAGASWVRTQQPQEIVGGVYAIYDLRGAVALPRPD